MNTAEYLVNKLLELGITDFFGIPGDYNFEIIKSVESNPDTNWIGCTNELNAGYAADGYARQKGFGALITTHGVGELSAINAIAGSYAENVPVIHIVGTPSTEVLKDKDIYHHNFQEPKPYAFWEAYKQITEASVFLNRDNVKIEIDRVLKLFVKERKPVYIAIPEDIVTLNVSNKNTDYDWVSNSDNLEKAIELITEKINQSKRPVILADTLIKRFDAKDAFLDFVNKTGIPVTNFLMGTNIVSMDNENYLGTYLSRYGNQLAKEYLETTDCLISVGVIYGDVNSYGVPLPYKINSQIAIYGTYTYIEGQLFSDVKMSDVLCGLSKRVGHKNYKIECPDLGYATIPATKEKLSSKYIYPRLQEFFKGEDIIVAESGTIPQGVAGLKLPENCELHSQLLWCSIGWALPAAFGAAIANRKSRIIVLTGDGAHQMSAMEIGAMGRYGVKPVVIVINNGGYAIERFLSETPNSEFNDVMQIDYAKLARSFKYDIWSTKVETEDDFDKALRVTQIMDKLCYIEAITEKTDLPEIGEELFTGKERPNAKKKTLPEIHSKNKKNDEKLKVSYNKNYATNVHTSLKDFETVVTSDSENDEKEETNE